MKEILSWFVVIACLSPSISWAENASILGVTVVKNEPVILTLNVEIDNRSDDPSTIECVDTLGGVATQYWLSSNKPIQKGRHVYEASIGLNSNAPDRHESDGILCQIFSVRMEHVYEDKQLPFKKTWDRFAAGGSASANVNIFGMTVSMNAPDKLILNVDVDNHAEEPATLLCQDTYQGQSTGFWKSSNKPVLTGRHVYEASIELSPRAPDHHESDGIVCRIYPVNGKTPRTLAERRFPLKKSWDWSPPNKISAIRVVKDGGESIEVEVDYTYAGDYGDANIYVDCHPYTDTWFTPFEMLPASVMVGKHTTRARMGSYAGTPANIVSTKIQCVMNSRKDQYDFIDKTISYRKLWKPLQK